MTDRKAPQIDRSSKPQVSSYNQNGTYGDNKVSHLSWANREERMTPVHGSVVSIYSIQKLKKKKEEIKIKKSSKNQFSFLSFKFLSIIANSHVFPRE